MNTQKKKPAARARRVSDSGMTLIETLVAITILTVAVAAPMSLTVQSLSASFFARDQVVAFNLAQEAIESVRSIRDGNILRIAFNDPDPSCSPTTLLCGIPIGSAFTIDTRNNAIATCDGACGPIQTNGDLYGYEVGWDDTAFRRTVNAAYIPGTQDEIRVEVEVRWDTGIGRERVITIYENLHRWVNDDV
jgi:prepilin-type N-terminal cleavage/methylation domain-containing protein